MSGVGKRKAKQRRTLITRGQLQPRRQLVTACLQQPNRNVRKAFTSPGNGTRWHGDNFKLEAWSLPERGSYVDDGSASLLTHNLSESFAVLVLKTRLNTEYTNEHL